MHSFIQSDLFELFIGQEKRQFVVHSKAIAATSPVFDKLVNGGLKESQDRCAVIEDVDCTTFIRFLEYAYRRDYTIPRWTQDPSIAEVQDVSVIAKSYARETPSAFSDEGWSNSKSAPSDFGAIADFKTMLNSEKHINDRNPRAAFNKREYRHPVHDISDPDSLHPHVHPVANTSPSQNFTPVFLAHAQLYTFADMRIAQRLKDLVLHKLHGTLVKFHLYRERLGDVAELVRYAYEHGEDRAETGRIDALRELVLSFVVAEMAALNECRDFRDLMEAGGELSGDFWDIISKGPL